MLSAVEHRQATRTMGLCFELVYLDDYWTRAATEGAVTDASGLQAIIDAMDHGFGELAEGAESFIAIVKAHEERMRTLFEAAVAGSPLPGGGPIPGPPLAEEQRSRVSAVVERRGGGELATAVVSATEDLSGRLSGEREQLRAEFERVTRGSASDGDMSAEAREDVALIALGASILLGVEAGAVVAIAAGIIDFFFG